MKLYRMMSWPKVKVFDTESGKTEIMKEGALFKAAPDAKLLLTGRDISAKFYDLTKGREVEVWGEKFIIDAPRRGGRDD